MERHTSRYRVPRVENPARYLGDQPSRRSLSRTNFPRTNPNCNSITRVSALLSAQFFFRVHYLVVLPSVSRGRAHIPPSCHHHLGVKQTLSSPRGTRDRAASSRAANSSTSRGEFVRLVPGALPVPRRRRWVATQSFAFRRIECFSFSSSSSSFFPLNRPVVSEDARWMTVWTTLAEEIRASDLILRVIDGVTKSSKSDQCETRNRGIISGRGW